MTKAQEQLLEQFDKLGLDNEMKEIIKGGVENMSDEEALRSASDLKAALDILSEVLPILNKEGK